MPTTRERDVEHYLVYLCNNLGLACMKFVPTYDNGMPDRLILLPDNKCVWVELKTKGGRLAPLQMIAHKKLRKLGHDVEIVWTKDQAKQLMDKIKETL